MWFELHENEARGFGIESALELFRLKQSLSYKCK